MDNLEKNRTFPQKSRKNIRRRVREPSEKVKLTTAQRPPQGASGAPRRGCMRNPNRHEQNRNQHEKHPNLQAKP